MRGDVSGHKTRLSQGYTRRRTEDHGETRAGATVERSTVHVNTHLRLRGMFASSKQGYRNTTRYGAVGGEKFEVEKTIGRRDRHCRRMSLMHAQNNPTCVAATVKVIPIMNILCGLKKEEREKWG